MQFTLVTQLAPKLGKAPALGTSRDAEILTKKEYARPKGGKIIGH